MGNSVIVWVGGAEDFVLRGRYVLAILCECLGFKYRLVDDLIEVPNEGPLLGYGPDTHVRVMRRFNREYVKRFKDLVIIDRAHNNYLDTALGQGLLGLGAYLCVIITFMIWLWRTRARERDVTRKALYCGVFAAVCGYLVNDLFIFSVVSVSPTFWSLMGITIAMKRLSL